MGVLLQLRKALLPISKIMFLIYEWCFNRKREKKSFLMLNSLKQKTRTKKSLILKYLERSVQLKHVEVVII